jgi:hypothetical protein
MLLLHGVLGVGDEVAVTLAVVALLWAIVQLSKVRGTPDLEDEDPAVDH